MITTEMYYWHDGILEKTDKPVVGCSHLIVTIVDGIPVSAFTRIFVSDEVRNVINT